MLGKQDRVTAQRTGSGSTLTEVMQGREHKLYHAVCISFEHVFRKCGTVIAFCEMSKKRQFRSTFTVGHTNQKILVKFDMK